jgi:hypothetical protein
MKPNRKAEKARRLNQPPMSAEDAKKQCDRVKAGSKSGPSYCSKLAVPPYSHKHGEFVMDLTYSTVLACSGDDECPLRFNEREVEKDGNFMCPNCGQLGRRMIEATPEQCGL